MENGCQKQRKSDENWFKIGIILWIWFLIISFFAYNKYLSFIDAIIFVRFLIYILVIQNLVIVNNNVRENIIKIINNNNIQILQKPKTQIVSCTSILFTEVSSPV